MAKRPLPKASSGGKDVLMVNQLTVRKSVQFPELQAAVATATGGSKDSNGKKDDTLTKDEFNSGFQDGVGQIKEGFAGLGAGLGPLQIIVDFIKGFVSKIGNLFTIFQGFFNILMSIPKAIANAFKKKDKDDDKKDKKKGKLKNALEKGKKKERDKDRKASGKGRAGFARFATMLKPMLIVGAVLAISAGLIMLYNWLVGKGLFKFFDDLGISIRLGLLNLQIGLANAFGKDTDALEEEKAAFLLERVVTKIDDSEKERIKGIDDDTARADQIVTEIVKAGGDKAAAMRLVGDKGVSDAQGSTEILNQEFNYNAGDVTTTDLADYEDKVVDAAAEFYKNVPKLIEDLDLDFGSRDLTSSKFLKTEDKSFSLIRGAFGFETQNFYGQLGVTLNDELLTVEAFADLVQTEALSRGVVLTDSEAMTEATAYLSKSNQMGLAIGRDGKTVISTSGKSDREGNRKIEKDDTTKSGFTEIDQGRDLSDDFGVDGFYVDTSGQLIYLPEVYEFEDGYEEYLKKLEELSKPVSEVISEGLVSEDAVDVVVEKTDRETGEIIVKETLKDSDDVFTQDERDFEEALNIYRAVGGDPSEMYSRRRVFDKGGKRASDYFYDDDGFMEEDEIYEKLVQDAANQFNIPLNEARSFVNTYVEGDSVTTMVVPQNDNGPPTGSHNAKMIEDRFHQ